MSDSGLLKADMSFLSVFKGCPCLWAVDTLNPIRCNTPSHQWCSVESCLSVVHRLTCKHHFPPVFSPTYEMALHLVHLTACTNFYCHLDSWIDFKLLVCLDLPAWLGFQPFFHSALSWIISSVCWLTGKWALKYLVEMLGLKWCCQSL